jgi:xyloglucan-specific exo-beta-1,4-glucanase
MRKKLKHITLLALTAMLLAAPGFPGPKQVQAAVTSVPYTFNSVTTGAGGGYVDGIVFNKTERDLIYARTDIGGAYRWDKTNNSWIPITDMLGWNDWNKFGVDALATDPVDPNRVYLAVGLYTNSWDHDNGSILRSTDRGNTWQTTTLPFKVGGNMPGRGMGERLMVDPNKNNILFFGARSGNGLWKSTDYGATWSKVTSFPNAGGYRFPEAFLENDIMGLTWIEFDKTSGTPGNPTQTIYVGVADTGTSVYKSTDGGATWSAVPNQPTGLIPHHGVLSSNGNLYITYSNTTGPYDGSKGDVWKLNTATGVWTNISPVPSSSNSFGYGGISVDAQQPNTLVVATLNQWWPDNQMYRSTDGGATWKPIWEWSGDYPNRALHYTQDISAAPWLDMGAHPEMPIVSPSLGWMIDDLEIDPFNSNRMMYGTGATLYGTNNLTAWDTGGTVNISVMAKGIEETAVLGLISPPSGAHLLTAVGDVAGFRHDDLLTAPSHFYLDPHYANTTGIDYAGLVPNYIVRVGPADYNSDPSIKSLAISTDGGTTWSKPTSEPAWGTGAKGGGTVAVAADASSILWSTDKAGVFYSNNGGATWTQSAVWDGTMLPTGAKIASDRVNKNVYYAFFDGKMYTSWDGGAHFSINVTSGLPTEGSAELKAVPGKEGEVWFAGGSADTGQVYGLWHSSNYGGSYTKLSNVEQADSIGFGKAAPGQTYSALYTVAKIDGVRGIFRSDDVGATWVRINDDQHQYTRPGTITGDPRIYGRVYFNGSGRGTFFGDPALSGTYKITNKKSGLALSVPGSSGTAGTQLVQSAYNGGLNQQWSIAANSNGTYRVKNRNSNQSVDVSGGNPADGVPIIQWTDNTGHNQEWILEPIADGNYKMISKQTAKAVAVANASNVDGANIAQATYTNDATTNDEWIIEKVQ